MSQEFSDAQESTFDPQQALDKQRLDPDKQEYLRYLAIGHFVMAALAFLFGAIPLIHVAIGLSLASGVSFAPTDEALVGLTFGLFFALIGLVLVLSAWAYAGFMIKAGRALTERRHYVLCMVMAAVSCIFAPVGTVIGVFTILLLLDDDVKAAFGR